MNKITKNYVYNLLYQLFVIMVPIVTAPYLARTLGSESQGISSYVVSISNIISTVTLFGIYNYGNRQVAYERDNRAKMSQTFWEIMLLRLILAIPGSLIYLILAISLNKYTDYLYIYYIWMLGTYLDCTWVYVGIEDMRPAVVKNFIAKLCTVSGIFLLVKGSSDIKKYLLLLGLSVLVANLLAYTQLSKFVNKPKVNMRNLFIHLKGSINLFLPTVATLVYLQVDKVMIEVFTRQTNQVAFYDNSEKIVTIPLTFITVLSTVMMPRIANEFIKQNYSKVEEYLIKAGEISLYLAFPMTVGLFAIAEKFVPWYLGNEYYPVIYGIMIISPMVISNTLEGISGRQFFTATNQINILAKSYTITAIMNIVVNMILIPKFGFIGAAIATLISSYTCTGIQFYYLNKQIDMKKLIIVGIKYFIYSIVMLILIRITSNDMNANPITTIIQIVVGTLVYLIISIVTKDKIFFEIINKISSIFIKKSSCDYSYQE